ncbi:glutathione S-transferase family protein [Alteromonas lipolytica]|uniref:Glutathione S-transferase n=1 Tax=Alteromonas lipolytica TaxID=1856405 RepID=A0A1E8F9T1_9ALTE|nr:glutathione S-transferase family protein [Alteromonas lipolytica]OFI32378.1 glutathione S-transferase [Alteromonas lipolytica]GGF86575.1 glutathione S-transferase [Alteromonas lipolytica]
MKLYDTKTAPNPRRVRIFLAEKGVEVDSVQIDLKGGQNLSPEMRAKNPTAKIPILELDDGTCISESDAICAYLEAVYPEPPLMGSTPLEKGVIAMWQRRVDLCLMQTVVHCFQHTTGYFSDRMTPVAEYGEVAGKDAVAFLDVLEQQLATTKFIAGEQFSIADIIALCAIDFARVVKIRIGENQTNLQRWYAEVSSRPSAQA